LEALVLDCVSSPITKRVYNMALNEFMEWFQQTARPGFTKATVSAWRRRRGWRSRYCASRLEAHCAKLCRAAGGELEQIQMLLGHASVQTTERYLGTKQDLVHAPNDAIKLKVI
jgi:integrase